MPKLAGYFKLAIICLLLFVIFNPSQVFAAKGDGMLLYGEGAVATPRYRTWANGTNTLSGENTGIAAAATIRHTIARPAPTRNEVIMGVQSTTGVLYIQRWNGAAWSNEWNVTVGNGNLPRFDIAYERKSGKAFVMYSSNAGTPNELRYRTFDGASWSGPNNYDAIRTSGVIHAVKLASQKASNYIAVAWGDANLDLSANFWNGDNSTFSGEPTAALSGDLASVSGATPLDVWCYDLAFENVSNELLITWGDDGVQDLKYATRTAGPGGSWSGVTTNAAFLEEPTDLELKSEPFSDYIGYANISNNGNSDAEAAIWDGSAWSSRSNYDLTADTVAASSKNTASTWLINGAQSRYVVIYDDTNAVGVDYVYFNKNTTTWTTTPTDFTTAPAPVSGNDRMMRMSTNPFDLSQAMATIVDNASDLFTKKLTFDGTNLTWSSVEPGGVSPELTMSSITGFAADFVYYRFISTSSLGVDIVDANNSPVGSPSVAFTGLNTSFSCQTSTGTLGSSSAKIRIDNGTANELWTLTIAATGGVATNWSNGGTGQYDYNDSSGSPGGCTDGGDSDSLAGQLSFDASASVVTTADYDCDTSGITKGSSASFQQGTQDSITLLNTSSSAIKNCIYDTTGINTSQQVPPETPTGSYSIGMTLTITAN
jgi:hypothetical protein